MAENSKFRYIRKWELCELLGGVSRSKIERDVAAGILPAPYRLGARMVAWRADELEEHLKSLSPITDAYASRRKNKR